MNNNNICAAAANKHIHNTYLTILMMPLNKLLSFPRKTPLLELLLSNWQNLNILIFCYGDQQTSHLSGYLQSSNQKAIALIRKKKKAPKVQKVESVWPMQQGNNIFFDL